MTASQPPYWLIRSLAVLSRCLQVAACGRLLVVFGGSLGGLWASGRTPGSSFLLLWGLSCRAACVAKPTRELGEPGLFRLLPAGVLWALWAPCWGRLGALLAVSGGPSWSLEVPVGLPVGSFGPPFGAFRVAGGSLRWPLAAAGWPRRPLGPSVGPWLGVFCDLSLPDFALSLYYLLWLDILTIISPI